MSFFTSLSGLKAAQTDMSTISHNLANVATNGFKKSRTEFADVIASSVSLSPNQMVGSGVVTKGIFQQFGQGTLKQSDSSLSLAIAGDGFFAVKPDQNGSAVNFTRSGGFLVDSDRNVVDAKGGHLQVFPVDGSGTVVATGLDQTVSLHLPETSGTPTPTTSVTMGVNLNSGAVPPTGAFDRFNPTTYNQSTQTTVYDSGGNPLTMTTYFRKTGDGQWDAYNYIGDTQLAADATNPQPIHMTFDATGTMTAPTGPTTFAAYTPPGSADQQVINFSFTSGSTQLASAFDIKSRDQNGEAVGKLQDVTVDADGIVRASFSNGESQPLGKIALASFANPSGLRQLGDSYWSATGLSGQPALGQAGGDGYGSLMSGMIEGSNVDITEELVNLIAAQRNFQANAKALDTSSQISQTIFNIQ